MQTHLAWLRQTIDQRNKQRRDHVLSAWRARMCMSQAERFKWAKAKYTSWQSIPDTLACFQKVEDIWKPILARRQDAPSLQPSDLIGVASDVAGSSISVERSLRQLDLLRMTGSDLRTAAQKSSAQSACGADGWRRSELLALPLFLGSFSSCFVRHGCFWHLAPLSAHGCDEFDSQKSFC